MTGWSPTVSKGLHLLAKVQLLQVGQGSLEVDGVERHVADVLPLAQLREEGVRRLSTEWTLINFPKDSSFHRILSFGFSFSSCIFHGKYWAEV